jgi:hypothetical protein
VICGVEPTSFLSSYLHNNIPFAFLQYLKKKTPQAGAGFAQMARKAPLVGGAFAPPVLFAGQKAPQTPPITFFMFTKNFCRKTLTNKKTYDRIAKLN